MQQAETQGSFTRGHDVAYWTYEDVRRRGWPVDLIAEFMRLPDNATPNDKAASTRLYRMTRVEKIESDPVFIAKRDQAMRRRIAITSEIEAIANTVEVTVDKVDDLFERAEKFWRARNGKPLTAKDAYRIQVMTATHKLLRVEGLGPLNKALGPRRARELLAWRALEAVADAYPDLTAECERQAYELFPDGPPKIGDLI